MMGLALAQVQKQVQRLIMTPQMQQSIQLLQMNSMELEALAQQEMLENPFLDLSVEESEPSEGAEEAETVETAESLDSDEAAPTETAPEPAVEAAPPNSPEAALADDREAGLELAEEKPEEKFDDVDADWDAIFDDSETPITSHANTYEAPEDETDFAEYTAKKVSLYEHLHWQLETAVLDEEAHCIGEYIISNINADGYLTVSDGNDETPFNMLEQDPEEVIRIVARDLEADPDDVRRALMAVQSFDPVGVGARNLRECLTIQLRARGAKDPLPYRILEEHFDGFIRRKFKSIAKALSVPEEEVRRAYDLLARLEPKPGRSITTESPHYVRPDVYVKEVDGRRIYYLNEGATAHLKINDYYRNLLNNTAASMTDKERQYALDKYRSALWLIKNIEKRKSTVLTVTEAIVEYQKGFLDRGVEGLRPLTLKMIAEEVGMHESTIARVTSSKYVETPRGILPLKYFFSSSLETDSGDAASSRSIKQMIQEIVESESAKKPLSDQKIAATLVERGIRIARRTVAKYREQMKILPAKLRKAV